MSENTRSGFTRFVCSLLSLSLALLSVIGQPVMAQSASEAADSEPPVIELVEAAEGTAGETQVFVAEISDNQNLLATLLFYRFAGDEQFLPVDMQPIGGTSTFSASVETLASDVRDIEYFIQAEDRAGNRAIKGFTFDPLIRTMRVPPESAAVSDPLATASGEDPALAPELADTQATAATTVDSAEKNAGRKKLLWGVAGLLIVAAIAVAINSSDGGNEEQPTDPTIEISNRPLLSVQW